FGTGFVNLALARRKKYSSSVAPGINTIPFTSVLDCNPASMIGTQFVMFSSATAAGNGIELNACSQGSAALTWCSRNEATRTITNCPGLRDLHSAFRIPHSALIKRTVARCALRFAHATFLNSSTGPRQPEDAPALSFFPRHLLLPKL